MNVHPIDLGDELGQGIQFRLALAPINTVAKASDAPATRAVRLRVGTTTEVRSIWSLFFIGKRVLISKEPAGCRRASPKIN